MKKITLHFVAYKKFVQNGTKISAIFFYLHTLTLSKLKLSRNIRQIPHILYH